MSKYKQLSLEERKKIYLLKKDGLGPAAIAKALERHKTTVTRELERNTFDKDVGYLPDTAHNNAQERKAKHGLKVARIPELEKFVVDKLKDRWSPEMIAGRLKQTQTPFSACHETIYTFVYSNEGMALGLYKHLVRARPKRGSLCGRKVRKEMIKDRISIHNRPEHINQRSEVGHLEGDLTFFKGNKSMNIGVVVDRKTRFSHLILNQSKQTAIVMKGLFNQLAALLPESMRKSITFDNGLEFARHTLLKKCMGMDTYFCDKSSPWQKGQVEQMNVMLHRYLPKKSIIKDVSAKQIQQIQNKLNNLPRKCLGFKTPSEAFYQELSQCGALQP